MARPFRAPSADGSGTFAFTGNETSNTFTVEASSGGITINGMLFIFNDITIALDLQTETFVSCSGSASVDGFDCDVAGDCSACTF